MSIFSGVRKAFKKVFRGVKKVWKGIGRGIKKVVAGVGKFMNKIGIVGQIALMFIPGVGPMLSTMFKGMGGIAAGALKAMGPIGSSILKGAQFVVGKAGEFITAGKNAFGTITDGIGSFVKEFTKTGLNKLGLDPTKFGFSDVGSSTFSEAWGKVTTDITANANKILDPFRSSVTAGSNTTLQGLSDSSYNSVDSIKQMNPQIQNWDDISGKAINLDPDNVSQVFGAGPLQSTANKAMNKPSLLDKLELQEVPGGRTVSLDALDPTNIDPVTGNIIPKSTTSLTPTGSRPSYLDSLTDIRTQTLQDPNFRVKGVTASSTGDGFFDTTVGGFAKDVGVSAAKTMATQGLMSLATGDAPEPPNIGYTVDAGTVQVSGAGGAVDYGIGGDQFLAASLRQPKATGLYDGTNTYAANFKAFYRA